MALALPRIDARRLGLSLVIAVALVMAWFAVTRAQTGGTGLGPKDPAIENVSPGPDELVLRQSQIVVDLAPGYRGDIYVDGQQIPVVDVVNDAQPGQAVPERIDGVFDPAQNTITFTPTVGATIEEFAPRTHQVTVTYWKVDESPAQGRNYSWSFRVQG